MKAVFLTDDELALLKHVLAVSAYDNTALRPVIEKLMSAVIQAEQLNK